MQKKYDAIFLSHWNHFISLENDLDVVSRYVEFHEKNYGTFSVEFVRLYLSVCSEIDVLLKPVCNWLNPSVEHKGILYRKTMLNVLPSICNTEIRQAKYKLRLYPWKEWESKKTPTWWSDHNKVKHERNKYYHKTNLWNVLNSMAGLFIVVLHYYTLAFREKEQKDIRLDQVYYELLPRPKFFRLPQVSLGIDNPLNVTFVNQIGYYDQEDE